MKKFLLAIVVLFASTALSSAQTFRVGDNVASVNLGLMGGYGVPVTLGYEYGIYDFNESMGLGLGANLGFGSTSDNTAHYLATVDVRYHYVGFNKFDLYGGLGLGALMTDYHGATADISDFSLGLYVGSRYYVNDWLGLNMQLGYGFAVLNFGVSFKF